MFSQEWSAQKMSAMTVLWIHRQIYREEKTQNIYIKGARNDGDLLAEWDVTPYIRILKVAPRPSKLCRSHFFCFVYIQKWRIAQMLLKTHWTTDRHWSMELLSTHLVKPVSRKPNTKLKSESAFRLYVAMGISCQIICLFINPVGKVDHLSMS